MPQSERLAAEYTAFVKQFGYEPAKLATSIDDVRCRIATASGSEVDREKRQSEFDDFIASLGPAAQKGVESLDPSGYAAFLDDVLAVQGIQRTTTDSVYCGEFPTGEFNASARRVKTGHLILLNRGLRQLLYNLSLAASYRIKDGNELSSAIVKPRSHEWVEIAVYVIGVILNYFKGNPFFDWKGCSHSQHALLAASGLSSSMRLFVIAHEVAHAELGHLDHNHTYNARTPLGDVEFISNSYEQEFEADRFAQQVSLEIARSDRNIGPVCGGVAFIMLDGIIELAKGRFFNRQLEPSTTHPLAEHRLTAIMEYVREYGAAVEYEWCQQTIAFFVQVYEIVEYSNVSFEDGSVRISFDTDSAIDATDP